MAEKIAVRRKWSQEQTLKFLDTYIRLLNLKQNKKNVAMKFTLIELVKKGVLERPISVDVLHTKMKNLQRAYKVAQYRYYKTGVLKFDFDIKKRMDILFGYGLSKKLKADSTDREEDEDEDEKPYVQEMPAMPAIVMSSPQDIVHLDDQPSTSNHMHFQEMDTVQIKPEILDDDDYTPTTNGVNHTVTNFYNPYVQAPADMMQAQATTLPKQPRMTEEQYLIEKLKITKEYYEKKISLQRRIEEGKKERHNTLIKKLDEICSILKK